MRIAFVSEPWDEVVPGGGGSSIALVTVRLAARLARHASILVYSAKRTGGRPDTERDAAGIEYRRIRTTPEKYLHRAIVDLEPDIDSGWFRLPYWASSFYYRGYARRIARELAASSCDVVHVHSFSQFVPIIRALNPQIKIVLHLHSDQFALLDRTRAAERLRQTDLVLGPAEHTVEAIRERFPEFADRCRVLTNGVDLERFTPRAGEPGPEGQLRCLYVGRVSPEKGLHVLLDAFARLRESYPHARLDVYGSNIPLPYNFFAGLSQDPAMLTLKEYFTSSGIGRIKASLTGRRLEYFAALQRRHGELFGRSVLFHGSVPNERLRDAYQGADLFVLPTVCREAHSLVLLEALASGVPVVATGPGGVIDTAAEAGAGLMVARNDSDALAEAMIKLAADPALRARMGRSGRELVSSPTFTWDRAADQLRTYYDELAPNAAREADAVPAEPSEERRDLTFAPAGSRGDRRAGA